jgi:MFS family permease
MLRSFAEKFHHLGKWLPLSVIVIVTIIASVNKQLIGLIAQPVKVEFGLSDTQLGGIFSIVGVVVAIISPLLGQMTDRFDRHKFLLGSILVWSIATANYGFAAGYITLVISVAVIASAETSLGPISNSIIADRYKRGDRINANLVYFAAGGLTTGIGSFLAGTLLQQSAKNLTGIVPFWQGASDWRVAMVVTGMLGIPLALIALTLGKDQRQANKKSLSDLSDLKVYWKDHWKTLITFNISNAGYFIAASATMGWIPIYLVRHFGISPADLGMRLGLVIGIADLLGILFGFLAIKKLYHVLGPIAPRYIFQFSLCGVAVLYIPLLAAKSAWSVFIIFGMQNFLATFGTASFNNMIQDMSSPGIRGKIFSINMLIISLVGIPGPLIVGSLSDYLGEDPKSLLWAILIVSVPMLLFSAILYSATNKIYLRTIKAVQILEQD